MMICRRKYLMIYILFFLMIESLIRYDSFTKSYQLSDSNHLSRSSSPNSRFIYLNLLYNIMIYIHVLKKVSSWINFVLCDFSLTDFISSRSSSSKFSISYILRFSLIKIWSIFEDVLSLIMNFTISIQLSVFFISRSDL